MKLSYVIFQEYYIFFVLPLYYNPLLFFLIFHLDLLNKINFLCMKMGFLIKSVCLKFII